MFNADQIEGLPEAFHPDACPVPDHTPAAPIPHMQAFFDAIDIATVFGGTEARYNPPVDKVCMPSIERFKNPLNFYGVWAHELAHATKAPHRLNRDYGLSRFGNTAYSREEIVAELTSCFLGQELGFTAHIRAAARAKTITLDTMKAFADHPSQVVQLEVFEALTSDDSYVQAYTVRQALKTRGVQVRRSLRQISLHHSVPLRRARRPNWSSMPQPAPRNRALPAAFRATA